MSITRPAVRAVARICHEANRAYCLELGDNSLKSWDDSPSWQRDSCINGVEFHIAEISMGREPNPATSHENWLKLKESEGWKYGLVKDVARKEHPCFKPYSELPLEQKMKDHIFVAIVKAFYQQGL